MALILSRQQLFVAKYDKAARDGHLDGQHYNVNIEAMKRDLAAIHSLG